MSRKRILLMGDQRAEGYGSALMATYPDTVFRHRKLGGIRSMDEVPSKSEILKDIYHRESFAGIILLMYNEELIDDSQTVSLYRECFQVDQIVKKTLLFVKEIHKIDLRIRVLVTIPSVVDLESFNNSFCEPTSIHLLNTYNKSEEIGRKHIEELHHHLLNEKYTGMEVLSLEKCLPSWANCFRQNIYRNGSIPKREGPVPSLFAIYVQDLFGLKYPAAKLMSFNDIWHDSAQSIINFHPKRFREADLIESDSEEVKLPEHNESLVPHFTQPISWLDATKILSDIGFHIDPDTYPVSLQRGEKMELDSCCTPPTANDFHPTRSYCLPTASSYCPPTASSYCPTTATNVFHEVGDNFGCDSDIPQVPSKFSNNVPRVSIKKRLTRSLTEEQKQKEKKKQAMGRKRKQHRKNKINREIAKSHMTNQPWLYSGVRLS